MLLPDREEWAQWLKERWWAIAATAALLVWGSYAWLTRPLHPPPGVLSAADPIQGPPLSPEPWTFREHRIKALASFEIRARILSRERYRWDRAAELSPIDFAMGWGPMSDSAVLDRLKVWQENRWYYWSTPNFPIPAGEITSHSANMHMIPATPLVRRQLLRFREGEVIHLRGQLVRVEGKDRWTWVSSLSRQDSGDGACEVIWVESVEKG